MVFARRLHACKLSGSTDPGTIAVLAAAYAEAGEFDKASAAGSQRARSVECVGVRLHREWFLLEGILLTDAVAGSAGTERTSNVIRRDALRSRRESPEANSNIGPCLGTLDP
jgi:hypothetical protein